MSVHIYSQSTSPLGKSVYLFDGVSAPSMYIPTLEFSAYRNKNNSSTNVDINISYPILTEVDGVITNNNTFKASFKYTSLRSIVNDTERLRVIDEMILFLTDNKASIAAGTVRPVV